MDEWLTGEQVESLLAEHERLCAERERITARLDEIGAALHRSGESKVRAMREAEEWADA